MTTAPLLPPPPLPTPGDSPASPLTREKKFGFAEQGGASGSGKGKQASKPTLRRSDSEGKLRTKLRKDKDGERPAPKKRRTILGKIMAEPSKRKGHSSSSTEKVQTEFVCNVPIPPSSNSTTTLSPVASKVAEKKTEGKPPPKIEMNSIYVARFPCDAEGTGLEVKEMDAFVALGFATKDTGWVVVEMVDSRRVGFYPSRWLARASEDGPIEPLCPEESGSDVPPPPRMAFEIAKPLLDNTSFLRHVGLHNTVKTLKILPTTTTDEMRGQLTQLVCRSLASYVHDLVREECSICQIVEVTPDGTENILASDDYPFKYHFKAKQSGDIANGWHFLFKRANLNTKKDSHDEKRHNIVAEIHSTEVYYCSALLEMIEGFKKPLLNLSKRPKSCVKEEDMIKLFGNCETILQVHVELFKPLNQRLHNWTPTSMLGDIFLKIAPVMIIYTEYSTGYGYAADLWHRYQSNPEFVAEHSALRKKMALDNLLIMPVQRLPRYNLLLRDLLKHTPDDHPDVDNLKKAIAVIQRLCDRIDECTEKAVTMQHMMDRANKDNILNAYFAAHRRLIFDMEVAGIRTDLNPIDLVSKMSKDVKSSQIRDRFCFYCFNDMLVCGSESDGKKKMLLEVPYKLTWITKKSEKEVTVVVPYAKFSLKCDDADQCDDFMTAVSGLVKEALGSEVEDEDSDEWMARSVRSGVFSGYDGEWKKGLPHGRGKRNLSESAYEGDWVFGKIFGNGKCIFANGDVYDGGWVNGLMDGAGKYTNISGAVYEGALQDNKFNGKGVLSMRGYRYEGDFVDNVPNGSGRLEFGNEGRSFYEGDFVDGAFHGIGKLHSKGSEYAGDFRMGLRHGSGLQHKTDGSIYEGDWRHDLRHGKGRYIDSLGNTYNGQWENNLMHGPGKMVFEDGSIFEGNFQNGYRHGKMGKFSWPAGHTFVGGFKFSKYHGPGVLTLNLENGMKQVVEGTWENGLREGRFVVSGNGKPTTITYKSGVPQVAYQDGQDQYVVSPASFMFGGTDFIKTQEL